MVNTQLKILRVFGPTGAEVSSVLRGIRDDGCPGLRLLERDGEFAICVQVSAPNRAMAEQYCDKWAARLRAKFGDDVFAEGETSLAQATLDALLEKRKLLVAVDEPTGRLLGSLLQPLPHSEAVFDFGTESYADPQKSRRITVPEQLLRRFPGDIVQAAAGRALAALQVTGADYAAAYMPASVGQCPFVLVCDRRGAVACALPPDMNDTFIGNQILDLLRRRLFGLQLTDSCITFRPGHDRPLLVVSEAARSRGNTVRFSLPLQQYSEKERSRTIGVVLTDKTQAGGLTVYELVALGRQPHTGFFGRLHPKDHLIIKEALDAVGIAHKAESYTAELSDGERQKVMIAKALVQECPLIILDEPTAFLDVVSRIEIMTLLHQLAVEQNKAILLSTHDIEQALVLSDKLWLLSKETGLQCGVTEDMILNHRMDTLFSHSNIRFDYNHGIYYPTVTGKKEIRVEAENDTLLHWTINALNRHGYTCLPANQGNRFLPYLQALSDHRLILTQKEETHTYSSFEEVLAQLI